MVEVPFENPIGQAGFYAIECGLELRTQWRIKYKLHYRTTMFNFRKVVHYSGVSQPKTPVADNLHCCFCSCVVGEMTSGIREFSLPLPVVAEKNINQLPGFVIERH